MATAISNSRTATPYLYQGSCGATRISTWFIASPGEFATASVQSSGALAGQSAVKQTMLLRVPLVTRCPEVEQDERREHVERDVQISYVGVDAGKNQRIGDAASRRLRY